MTTEEKYKEALSKIENIVSFIEEQDSLNMNDKLAIEQDNALSDIYKIVEESLK